MIVSFLNQKGGVGKTTMALNVAYCLQSQGHSVLLVDSDIQGSARNWHAQSGGEKLEVIGLDRPTLDIDIKKIRFEYDWIIIDGLPHASIMTGKAIKCSDVVLIPDRPSPLDIWASRPTVDLIKEHQNITDKPKAAFIFSQNQPRTNLSRESLDVIKGYELSVFESYTCMRIAYAESVVKGLSVMEWTDKNAAQEILSITEELKVFANDK